MTSFGDLSKLFRLRFLVMLFAQKEIILLKNEEKLFYGFETIRQEAELITAEKLWLGLPLPLFSHHSDQI